jgi:hypothetical protein
MPEAADAGAGASASSATMARRRGGFRSIAPLLDRPAQACHDMSMPWTFV